MNIKGLLLGSAAALVAVSGARAADAVVIAEPEPMEYVRICDTYGVGYYYIPGTETCLKVSGYIRYDIGIGSLGHENVWDKEDEAYEETTGTNDTYYKRARFQLRVDSRTETELGTLRTYAAINFNFDTSNTEGKLGGNVYTHHSSFDGGFTDANDGVSIDHAYIELGGFRVGKTDSMFSTFTGFAGGVINDTTGVSYGPFGTHQIAYTFNGGNGFTAAVALETGDGDSTIYTTASPVTGGPIRAQVNSFTIDSYVPHIVAGVGWTGGWGGVSVVGGYDSNYGEGAIKGRVDFNATDALSLFLMAAWSSNDDESFGEALNYYAPWGGDWAVWAGGTFKATEKAAVNVQVGYDDFENFAFVANVAYELVPNFTITPEFVYTDNFDADDADNIGGFLRLQANFGG